MGERKHIMLAMPAYTGVVHLPTMRSLLADIMGLARRGDLVSIEDEVGCGLIHDARAYIFSHFLQSDCTHLMFIDWDVCWQKGAILKLADYDYDIVGGIYPQRKDPITFSVRTDEEGVYPVDQKTQCVEVAGLHGGFMRISRACAEKMVEGYKNLAFQRDGKTHHDLFSDYWYERPDGSKGKLGEDYAFCQRWRDLGGKVWLDPSIYMGHIGQKTFAGEFGRFVDAQDKSEAA